MATLSSAMCLLDTHPDLRRECSTNFVSPSQLGSLWQLLAAVAQERVQSYHLSKDFMILPQVHISHDIVSAQLAPAFLQCNWYLSGYFSSGELSYSSAKFWLKDSYSIRWRLGGIHDPLRNSKDFESCFQPLLSILQIRVSPRLLGVFFLSYGRSTDGTLICLHWVNMRTGLKA